MRDSELLRRRIEDRRARVCVIGQGYVGLTLAAAAAVEGFQVTGVDLDADRIAALSRGELVVPGVEESLFIQASESEKLRLTVDFDVLEAADIVVICVPTPVTEHRPDLSMVEGAAREVGARLRRAGVGVGQTLRQAEVGDLRP